MPALADLNAPPAGAPALAIIGCGNPLRSDDGVGPAVIALLRAHDTPPGVALHDAGTDGMGVLYRTRGMTHLVIVDARAPSGAPGAIYEVPGEMLEQPPSHGMGLHDFRWDHALYAGRRINGQAFPICVKVFLVEAETLALSIGLSACVHRAALRVCDTILALSEDFAHGRWV